MRTNPRVDLYVGHPKLDHKHYPHNRGASRAAPEFGSTHRFDAVAPHSQQLVANTVANRRPVAPIFDPGVALHQSWAQNVGSFNRHCANMLWLARPIYFLPLELTQQYFSFIFGLPRSVSEPLGSKQMAQRQNRPRRPYDLAGPMQDTVGCGCHAHSDGQCEEMQRAHDVATGESTEMWFEIIHEGGFPGQEHHPTVARFAAA
jgi:hypothetical protein